MVKVWREKVVIPTYEIGKPEKAPMFLERRVYQGSSGVVYPYPVIESVSDTKTDKTYNAVFLENEYIKVMILPELGGRVQMAYDKIAGRHFIYYNRVIKPALVGLAGPWISGGIEFNWPQHHRPSTFMSVDCNIEENREDGSVTVWCGERERMFHQKGMAGFTLRPGHAYLEIRGVLYNPTEVPQTFLWWANPAVKVNDAYQSVFPPDVNAVFDHGKRAVSSFPIATGTYYKVDYSAGVDISNYKNIPVPTSYMVAKSDYDFEGGYENDARAGMLHVANHNVSPGKKQWTWGNGDFGRAWDRNLTDEDGPYIELMAGVYTENQPDFSWLQPYEEKSFVQYFFPYRELGIVKNANKDVVLNLLPSGDGKTRILIYATSAQECEIRLLGTDGNMVFGETVTVRPEAVYDKCVDTDGVAPEGLTLWVNGLCCRSSCEKDGEVPPPATAALRPEEISTCEQLYLTGLHLEQYRHASWSAFDYYSEAVRRDPDDVRNNNALGLWFLRRGRFEKAEPYLRHAVEVLQRRNLNPYDGEPLYNLALCLKYMGRLDEAYKWFYKATWNAAWQDAAYFSCAQISASRSKWEDALDEVNHSLVRNWHNHKARALKCSILRHMGRVEEAKALSAESVGIDTFNFGCRFEQLLLGEDVKGELQELLRSDAHNYNEIALDYLACGLKVEADVVWDLAQEAGAMDIMGYYYRGSYGEAACSDTTCVFPNRLEAIQALRGANPDDYKAPFLLGNLFYDKRQYDLAVSEWEKSVSLNPEFPTAWRNLALAYYNKQRDPEKARTAIEKAFELDKTDSRILMELDQLYKKLGVSFADRLSLLQSYPALVGERDDLLLEEITLLNLTGRYIEAMAKLDGHIFHPWEGGEGKVTAQYQFSRIELAKIALREERYADALRLLEECLVYPHNLGEGRLVCAQEQDIYYLMALSFQGLGDQAKASACLKKASEGELEPVNAMYYNDAKPEKIFYQGLSFDQMGDRDSAVRKYRSLVEYGNTHFDDKVTMDYFAVSLPDLAIWEEDLDVNNKVHCLFMMSLGYWGLGQKEKASECLDKAAKINPYHLGIASVLSIFK